MDNVLCVIPARGGSKGLPSKNLLPLAGRPLLVHTIRHAQEAGLDPWVSTDSRSIANVALATEANVIERPEHLSGDFVESERAVEHVLEATGTNPDLVVMLQCTNPIRDPEDIPGAMLLMEEYDSVLSVVEMQQFVWNDDDRGAWASNYNPVAQRPMRQQVNQYIENGSIYVFRPSNLLRTGARLFGRIGLYVMKTWSRFEIDTADDLALVEWIIKNEY